MKTATLAGAGIVIAASRYALVTPLGADKVRKSLAVLRRIWAHAVAADARVGESSGIAAVALGVGGVVDLFADKRTLCLLRVAPILYCCCQSS